MKSRLPAILLLGLITPAFAQLPPDKPEASTSMFESTREPASDKESAAVVAELEGQISSAPAVFVRGYMVDRAGMTLYTFDRDRPGVSTCYRACEKLWPPLLADLDAVDEEEFSVIERMDGSRQWAWRGQPLYYWPYDKRPGDITGDNVSGVWHILLDPDAQPKSSETGAL
ncbi:MAG: hypothetical protein MEQ07_03130 [Aquimonas sp.]|nr:hypothetical protein [Aquimonas sp.]